MGLLAAAGRIGATVAAMAATRLELAAVEIQEEARRLFGYLALTMVAAILVAGAFLLTAVFVILVFWESYRLQAVAAMIALLGFSGAALRPPRCRPRWPSCATISITSGTPVPASRKRPMNESALAARRRALIERCAEQRVGLAYEWKALGRPGAAVASSLASSVVSILPPVVSRYAAWLLAHRRLSLGLAGASLGLALLRPKRALHVARLAVAGWRMLR
jgi:hypothetical protein